MVPLILKSHKNLKKLNSYSLFTISLKIIMKYILELKVSGPRVQTFCIEKDSHMDAI